MQPTEQHMGKHPHTASDEPQPPLPQPWLQQLKTTLLGRVPVLLQTEAAECGLLCVAMVAGYHGSAPDLAYLRREHRTSMRGASFEQLIRLAGMLKFGARALRVDVTGLKQLPKPCILHWDAQHFVVLVKTGWRKVVLHDPAFGRRVLTWRQVTEHFSGGVLELTPTHEFTQAAVMPPPKMQFWELTGRVVGLKKSLWQLFAFGVAIEAIALTLPFFMQWVTDHVLVTGDRELLVALVWGFAALHVLRTLLEMARGWALAVMSTWFNVQWMGNVFSHLLRLPIMYYERRHMGDIMSRCSAITHIQNTLTVTLVGAALDGILIIATVAMMALYSLPLTGLVLGATAVYLVFRWLLYPELRRLSFEGLVQHAKQDSVFMETLRTMPTIRANAHENQRLGHWMNAVVNTKNTQLQQQSYGLLFHGAQSLIQGLLQVVIAGIGVATIFEGGFSVGMLLAFLAYAQQFGARSMGFVNAILEFRLLEVQGQRLLDIVHQKPEQDPLAAALPFNALTTPQPSSPALQWVMHDLRFRYGTTDALVLAGVSLKVSPGDWVHISGAAGTGKSTLAHALMGFYPAAGGDLLIGGISAKKMGLHNYRRHVGVVLADDKLLAGTVAENICMFDPEPNLARIEACAQVVGLTHDINQLPMRFFSIVGDMGSALSCGQRQQLCLARALYRQPKFLVLDTALPSMSSTQQAQLWPALLKAGMAVVMLSPHSQAPSFATQHWRLAAGKLTPVAPPATPVGANTA